MFPDICEVHPSDGFKTSLYSSAIASQPQKQDSEPSKKKSTEDAGVASASSTFRHLSSNLARMGLMMAKVLKRGPADTEEYLSSFSSSFNQPAGTVCSIDSRPYEKSIKASSGCTSHSYSSADPQLRPGNPLDFERKKPEEAGAAFVSLPFCHFSSFVEPGRDGIEGFLLLLLLLISHLD